MGELIHTYGPEGVVELAAMDLNLALECADASVKYLGYVFTEQAATVFRKRLEKLYYDG